MHMAFPGQETQKKQAGDTISVLGSLQAPRGANVPRMQRVRELNRLCGRDFGCFDAAGQAS